MKYTQTGSHFAELSSVLLSIDREELKKAIELLKQARKSKRSVWIVGNGGSAATASHFANDLSKMAGVRAFCVPDMMPTVTAFGNDNGWEHMFEHPMDVYFDPGDVVVAISCSGNSMNVVKAASQIDNLIVLTGNEYQNRLAERPTRALLLVPHDDITVQEDVHLAMCHAIAKALAE